MQHVSPLLITLACGDLVIIAMSCLPCLNLGKRNWMARVFEGGEVRSLTWSEIPEVKSSINHKWEEGV